MAVFQYAVSGQLRIADRPGAICLGTKCGATCFLFQAESLPHTDRRSSSFKRNFVHGQFHQVDPAPVFGTEIFERQRIGNLIGIESLSLISDDDEHGAFAAATDMNQLARIACQIGMLG